MKWWNFSKLLGYTGIGLSMRNKQKHLIPPPRTTTPPCTAANSHDITRTHDAARMTTTQDDMSRKQAG